MVEAAAERGFGAQGREADPKPQMFNQTIAEALRAAWDRSDSLLGGLSEEALSERPILLRHPFLFYLGHLPAFAHNQVIRGVLGRGALSERFDSLFERGIDPRDEDAAAKVSVSASAWPPFQEVIGYRDEARRRVLAAIPDVLARQNDVLAEHGRVLHLVIEHERMHHETLLYMMQAHETPLLRQTAPLLDGDGSAPEERLIAAGPAVLGARFGEIPFGWDNEHGRTEVEVPAFVLDHLPTRNKDYRDFLRKKGDPAALWPAAWARRGDRVFVKTVFGEVPLSLAAGWPVQVSADQAAAYAAHRGGRLPTEAELCRAARATPGGEVRRYPWGDAPPTAHHGNFGFRAQTPVPVGSAPGGASAWGAEELVGNGWEHTSTVFGPLPGFTPYARTYPGYSADFFDGEHNIVFGASWATDEVFLRSSFRNWYRRDYPYVFSKFRVARDVTRTR